VPVLAPRCSTLLFAALVSFARLGVAQADALRKIDRVTQGDRGGSSSPFEGTSSRSGSRAGAGSARSRGGSSYEHPRGDDECDRYSDSLCDDDSLKLLLLYYTLGLPWSVPRLYDDPTLVGYAPYPFAHGPGVLRLAPHATPETDAQGVRAVALALDVESGYMLEGVVPGAMALRLQLPHRFELDSRVHLLSDVLDPAHSLAATATAHVAYRFAQGRRFDFRTGIGMRMFALDDVRMGIDFVHALDTYLGRRFVWRVELHAGNADKAFVGQARSTLGAMIGRCELYAGYDHTVYTGDGSRATLGGPIGGMRAWF
jgi:hypothetical protein